MFPSTCSKLLDGHEREPDECESFSQDFTLVFGRWLQLLPVRLGLGPTNCSTKQTHLPHSQSISLQNCHQCV